MARQPITFQIATEEKYAASYHHAGKEYVSWVWKLIRSIKVSTADLDCSPEAAAGVVTWTKTYKDEYRIINQGPEGGLTTMIHPCSNSDLVCV